jgi:WD40 repeat protein
VTPDKPENKLLEKNFYSNYKEKPSSLTSCAFSHNSRYIAVGSVDSVVKLWDLRGDKNADKDQNIVQIKSHMCGVTSLAWIKNMRSDLVGS